MPTGSQQTTESETPVPAATDTADPLFYPSWYKGQTRKATTNPPSTPGSEGLGHVGPPGSEDSNVQKAEVAEAAASERAAVSGKETSSPAATSQVSVDALVSECSPALPRVPPESQQERRASKGAERNCGRGTNTGAVQPRVASGLSLVLICFLKPFIKQKTKKQFNFTLMASGDLTSGFPGEGARERLALGMQLKTALSAVTDSCPCSSLQGYLPLLSLLRVLLGLPKTNHLLLCRSQQTPRSMFELNSQSALENNL